jgi:hypothetical protein
VWIELSNEPPAGRGQLVGYSDELLIPDVESRLYLWRETPSCLAQQHATLTKNSIQVLTEGDMSGNSGYEYVVKVPSPLGWTALDQRKVVR